MKRLTLLTILIALFSIESYSKIWTLSNANLTVQFDDQTLILTVTDKRCNKVWEQTPLKNTYTAKKISQKGNTITLSLTGKYSFDLAISLLDNSDLTVTLSGKKELPIGEFTFPSAFKTPDKNHYFLYTDSEGYLLAVDDTSYPIGRHNAYTMGGGLSMPWMGITDNKFESGYIAILDTPDDAAFFSKRIEGLVTFEPIWMPQLGKFGYDRKLIYHFFDKGGYVAQCKKYREYAWKKNGVTKLSEQQKSFPAIEKLIGAVNIYVWDDARQLSFAKELKQSGINKAFFLWNPNHPPYPEKDYDSRLKELGYLSGVYELFRDARMRDSVPPRPDEKPSETYLNRFSFPGLFKQITLVQNDGKLHYSGFGYDICPKAIMPLIPSLRVDRELTIYPHESYFIDGWQASGLFECYSKEHPLTRTQYKQTVIDISKMFMDKYKMIVGAEWGADYGVPTTAYVHGMMTLHRTWFGSDAYKRGTIYFIGSWGSSRPTIMFGTSTSTDKYLKYSINEYTRVPLYELVYHDATVTSWRWEDTNHKMPEIWWKKDLFNILYGNAPLWCPDYQLWRNFKNTFIESYNNVCPWLQKIGYDEMVSHRFITDDHKVQESLFSSGQRAIVNFGETDYPFEGKTIKAKGYILLAN